MELVSFDDSDLMRKAMENPQTFGKKLKQRYEKLLRNSDRTYVLWPVWDESPYLIVMPTDSGVTCDSEFRCYTQRRLLGKREVFAIAKWGEINGEPPAHDLEFVGCPLEGKN